jgi:hypothetical protein
MHRAPRILSVAAFALDQRRRDEVRAAAHTRWQHDDRNPFQLSSCDGVWEKKKKILLLNISTES